MVREQNVSNNSYAQKEGDAIQRYTIPAELLAYRQWVCWRYVDRGPGQKPAKQPVNARSLHPAGVQWANTWTDFTTAYEIYLAYRSRGIQGIGFVLTPADPYVAVDLDACIHDDTLDERAAAIITQLDSYTEISPSGQGIRMLLLCADFHQNIRRAQLEIYSHARYVTITGHHVPTTPPQIAPVTADAITALVPPNPIDMPHTPVVSSASNQYPVSNAELWARIFAHDKYGAQHLQRFQGDLSLDGNDHSLTVIRLLNCLARWTGGDAARIRSMMLLAPLANEKWFEQRRGYDWLDYQIADAIAYISGRK